MTIKKILAPDTEPDLVKFELPSEREHLFQVVDKFTDKMNSDIVVVKLEVAEGDELGRSLLLRVSLDPEWKGFFTTRLFLKAIGEEYKGEITIDDDNWIGRLFYATIKHNTGNNGKTYANIDTYNFEKVFENKKQESPKFDELGKEIAWDE